MVSTMARVGSSKRIWPRECPLLTTLSLPFPSISPHKVYCEGGVSAVAIEGGAFRDNRALEVGGAIAAWGDSTVVEITGGQFTNNTAK